MILVNTPAVNQHNMNISKHNQTSKRSIIINQLKGFTIIELMIAMVLGLTLVAGVFTVYTGTIQTSSNFVSYAKLDQETRAIMELITREVRRAGYDGTTPAGSTTDFGINEDTSSCLLYSYDMGSPPDGALQLSEQFGFKLTSGAVQFGNNATSCVTGTWSNINDTNLVEVSNLNFTLNRLCFNLNNGSDCIAIAAASSDNIVYKYQLDVSITANLKDDASVTRSLNSTLRLHNDILIQVP